jgi:hypothetical protein
MVNYFRKDMKQPLVGPYAYSLMSELELNNEQRLVTAWVGLS